MAPLFVPQVIWFESPAYKQNPEILADLFAATKAWNDLVQVYKGFQVEDPNVAIWLTLWESIQGYHSFMSSHPSLEEAFKSTSLPRVTVIKVLDTADDFERAINAPVTEIGEARPKPEHMDKLEILGELMSQLNVVLRKSKGNVAVCQGKNLEDDKVYTFTIGWNSVEEHEEAIKEGTIAGGLIGQITSMADVLILKHAILSPA